MTERRTYEGTHPWLRYVVDLRSAPIDLWMLLGEARSKCEHITEVPLLPKTAEEVHQLYLIKGAQATTAIEGNTLTEEEIRRHLAGNLRLPPSKEYLAREIDNMVGAFNHLNYDIMHGEVTPLSPASIKAFNREILKGLDLEDGVVPGEFRKHSVVVARYRGAPAEDCEYLVQRLCEWIGGPDFTPPAETAGMGLVYAILRAVAAHLYLAWIHPFGDGNGRTARFVEFQILVTAGIPTPAAHLLSNHYNETRAEYYRQLDQASKTGNPVPFIVYAVRGFVDQLKTQLAFMHKQHHWLVWRNYVEEQLDEGGSEPERRQIRLVLALSAQRSPVAGAGLRELTPELATTYATRTPKTLARDLNALERKKLIERAGKGYRARTEIVRAMLPVPGAPAPEER